MPAQSVGSLLLNTDRARCLFQVESPDLPGAAVEISSPSFEIDGVDVKDFRYASADEPVLLRHGGFETRLHYASGARPEFRLDLLIRSFPESPLLRYKFQLTGPAESRLTKSQGCDAVSYGSISIPDIEHIDLLVQELSHFDPVAHSYMPASTELTPDSWFDGQRIAGPIVMLCTDDLFVISAYEHGADHPDAFVEFRVHADAEESCTLEIRAARGNYYHGRPFTEDRPFESVWFELGLFSAQEDPLARYRDFFLNEISENTESRKPYIFYNTWNHQERNKYFRHLPYLADMNLERMLAEIDAAHRIGVDVFVIDTGWYGKTGDWLVNLERFPDGLREVKSRLDGYGMKLGLWFNPIVAAATSEIFVKHPEYVMEADGKPNFWGPIWETEESYGMCLASGYADHFIETMVRLNRELGVSYFKWDAISQYGCDSPHHHHGAEANSQQERGDCYAYESGRAMIRIVEAVSRRCPDVIVDFDVTEGGRFVGLGFLSVGKYFLINNGPYFQDFDIPRETKIEPDTINVFFHPGPARSRICRQGTKFDPIIPSVLFLTHYLPDGPALSQWNSLTSLMLGGNGFWGDLPALTAEDTSLLSEQIAHYKRVAPYVTRAYPETVGFAGSSPEIHEKVDPETGNGLIAFFTVKGGSFTYISQWGSEAVEVIGADAWDLLPDGRLRITVTLERNGARPVFVIGARQQEAAS